MRNRLEWNAWYDMKRRCLNPKHKDHPNYGGRGIGICARWSSFEEFLADMGPKPLGMTLERKEVNGDYEPANCKWASRKEQRWNRRDTLRAADGSQTCKRGHPWVPENIAKNGDKVRCRQCYIERQRRIRAAKAPSLSPQTEV
jgi:hypothetical protein